ncbi:MAG: DUF4349 domain-containing protein, partial [Armatimonadetes bacterium]|nr:DUF4349 domain-containing protein [Armatimonadota bacterium]
TMIAVGAVAVLGTVFFPVFAQSKMAEAGATAEMKSVTGAPEESMADMSGAESAKAAPTNSPMAESQNIDTFADERGRVLEKESAGSSPPLDDVARSTVLPPSFTQRDIIKNGSIDLLVQELNGSIALVENIAKSNSGYVESSNSNQYTDSKIASLTIRVDSKQFENVMARLRDLGEVVSESTSGEDVTAAIADYDARVKVLRIEEEQYRILLKNAKRLQDILDLKQRIGNVRMEIESYEAQLKSLKGMASLSTINISLKEANPDTKVVPSDWAGGAVNSASNALKAIGRFIGQTLIFVGILAPIWLPILGIGWWLRKRSMKP